MEEAFYTKEIKSIKQQSQDRGLERMEMNVSEIEKTQKKQKSSSRFVKKSSPFTSDDLYEEFSIKESTELENEKEYLEDIEENKSTAQNENYFSNKKVEKSYLQTMRKIDYLLSMSNCNEKNPIKRNSKNRRNKGRRSPEFKSSFLDNNLTSTIVIESDKENFDWNLNKFIIQEGKKLSTKSQKIRPKMGKDYRRGTIFAEKRGEFENTENRKKLKKLVKLAQKGATVTTKDEEEEEEHFGFSSDFEENLSDEKVFKTSFLEEGYEDFEEDDIRNYSRAFVRFFFYSFFFRILE